jgi:hypothetical protein
MSPIEAAFKTLWSEAQTLYLPDKLYVEISGDGTLSDSICRHDGTCCAVASGATQTASYSWARHSGRRLAACARLSMDDGLDGG